jgi:hypothetical protein
VGQSPAHLAKSEIQAPDRLFSLRQLVLVGGEIAAKVFQFQRLAQGLRRLSSADAALDLRQQIGHGCLTGKNPLVNFVAPRLGPSQFGLPGGEFADGKVQFLLQVGFLVGLQELPAKVEEAKLHALNESFELHRLHLRAANIPFLIRLFLPLLAGYCKKQGQARQGEKQSGARSIHEQGSGEQA